eukprot:5394823-Pyramimonas_sp.AAC.1
MCLAGESNCELPTPRWTNRTATVDPPFSGVSSGTVGGLDCDAVAITFQLHCVHALDGKAPVIDAVAIC